MLCINLARVLDPEVIILGGGMARAGEQLLGPVRAHIQALGWTVLSNHVPVVAARHAHLAGVLGAALAVSDELGLN